MRPALPLEQQMTIEAFLAFTDTHSPASGGIGAPLAAIESIAAATALACSKWVCTNVDLFSAACAAAISSAQRNGVAGSLVLPTTRMGRAPGAVTGPRAGPIGAGHQAQVTSSLATAGPNRGARAVVAAAKAAQAAPARKNGRKP